MEQEYTHPDFIKGFNEGYIIERDLPELSEKLQSVLSDSERSEGFKAGIQEMIEEREKDRFPEWLRSDRLSSLDNDNIEYNKDIDDIDINKD